MQPEILHNNPPKHFVVAILYKSCARTLQSAEFNMRQEKLPVNSIFCHVGWILLLLLQKTRGAMRANVNRLPVCTRKKTSGHRGRGRGLQVSRKCSNWSHVKPITLQYLANTPMKFEELWVIFKLIKYRSYNADQL